MPQVDAALGLPCSPRRRVRSSGTLERCASRSERRTLLSATNGDRANTSSVRRSARQPPRVLGPATQARRTGAGADDLLEALAAAPAFELVDGHGGSLRA